MAKTAAQRQAAYRARRNHAGHDGSGERSLSVWISTSTWLAIARLARRYAVTKRVLAAIELDSPQWHAYFDDTPLRHNDAFGEPEKEENMTLPT